MSDRLDLSSTFEHSSNIFNRHDSRTSIDAIREMTCTSPLRQEHTNLTVLDVYDEAALIGKDFERIIESMYFIFC